MVSLPREGTTYWVEMGGPRQGEFYPAASLETAERLAEAFADDSGTPTKIFEVNVEVRAYSSTPPPEPEPVPGRPCSSCGTSDSDCLDGIRRTGSACCARCHNTDTHDLHARMGG